MKGYYTDLAEKLSTTNLIGYDNREYTSFIASTVKCLAAYLDENRLCLSEATVSSFFKDWARPPAVSQTQFATSLIHRIVAALEPDLEVKRLFADGQNPAYNNLPVWGQTLIDEFCVHLLHEGLYSSFRKKGAVDFLIFSIEHGFGSTCIVDSRMTSSFFCLTGKYRYGVLHFIEFLTSLGLATFFSSKAYSTHLSRRAELYSKIPVERCADEISVEEYIAASERHDKVLVERGYSISALEDIKSTIANFGIFLEVHGIGFSLNAVIRFLDIQEKTLGFDINSGKRNVLMVLNDILHGKSYEEIPTKYGMEKPTFPSWCMPAVEAYRKMRKKNRLTAATLYLDSTALLKFCNYIDSLKITSFSEVNRQNIKDFNRQDNCHSTARGKAAYNYRIKGFLKFLAEEKWMTYDLSLCLPSIPAASVRPPVILTEEEENKIREYTEESASLRNKAILKIGMQTGLRAVDIVNLKFSSIDWNRRVFKVLQQKTRIESIIPFSNGVGNALYEYITKERPQANSDFIFLDSRAPYRPCGRNVVAHVLGDVFDKDMRGSHIMRKTFASKLTQTEPFTVVADALGHKNTGALEPYLSIDARRLRDCAIEMGECFAYTGGEL